MKKKLFVLMIMMMIAVCWTASALALTAVVPTSLEKGMTSWKATGYQAEFTDYDLRGFQDDVAGQAFNYFEGYELYITYNTDGGVRYIDMHTPSINGQDDFLQLRYDIITGDITMASYFTPYDDHKWGLSYWWSFDEHVWYDWDGFEDVVVTGIPAFNPADYPLTIIYVGENAPQPTTPPAEDKRVTLDNAYGKLAIIDANGNVVDYTGFEKFEGADFYFAHGIIRDDMDGLTLIDGTWYNMSTGQVNTSEGFVFFEGGTFYVKNGTLDKTQDGLIQYDGEWFVFSNGQFQPQVYGAWPDHRSGKFVYIWAGQFYPITDLVSYDGEIFYFINGYLATDFVGTVYDFNGTPFNVVYGQVY